MPVLFSSQQQHDDFIYRGSMDRPNRGQRATRQTVSRPPATRDQEVRCVKVREAFDLL